MQAPQPSEGPQPGRGLPWLAFAAMIGSIIAGVAFVWPLLDETPDLHRAASLAAAASDRGDLVAIFTDDPTPHLALVPPRPGLLILPKDAPLPTISPFARAFLVHEGTGPALPDSVELLESRKLGNAKVRSIKSKDPERPLAHFIDVFPTLKVHTQRNEDKRPCTKRDDTTFTCPHAGSGPVVTLKPSCDGLGGIPGISVKALPGQPLHLTLSHPHDLARINLQHDAKTPISLRLASGTVEKVARLAPDTPVQSLRPTRDTDLEIIFPAKADAQPVCLDLVWWGQWPESMDTWEDCAKAARRDLKAGAPWQRVWMWLVRGRSALACDF